MVTTPNTNANELEKAEIPEAALFDGGEEVGGVAVVSSPLEDGDADLVPDRVAEVAVVSKPELAWVVGCEEEVALELTVLEPGALVVASEEVGASDSEMGAELGV